MKHSLSKETVSESDSSGTESSSSGASERRQTTSKSKRAEAKSKSKRRAPSTSGSSSSDSDSDRRSNPAPKSKPSKKTVKIAAPSNPIEHHTPANPYKPPEGFQLLLNPSLPPSEISETFSNLRGKQMWHITAPASVPVSSMQELALDAVATGDAVLNHKGVGYSLREVQNGVDNTKALLLPDKRGAYRRQRHDVAQTFHLERVVDLPDGPLIKDNIDSIRRDTKPPRAQPKNLRMRYRPFGSSGQPDSSSDESEMEDINSQESVAHIDEERKEKKKKRKHTDGEVPSSNQNELRSESTPHESIPRKKTKKTHHDGEKGSKEKDRDEERRARREEKKRKKHEKTK